MIDQKGTALQLSLLPRTKELLDDKGNDSGWFG